MKIWVLLENTTGCENLSAEHGLSMYLETGARRVLFDMGQSAAFADNADKLGVDLEKVDTAILSHGHCDHSGGMGVFLQRNTSAKLYLSPYAFEPHYNKKGSYIGLDLALREHPQLTFEQDCQLGDGLSLHSCKNVPCLRPLNTCGLTVEENGALVPEDFRHEQYLLVQENGKRILISGCSHKGIVNLVHHFRPDVLIGGFHLMDTPAGSAEIDEIARILLEYPTVYYTGHCTGEKQYDQLKNIMGERLQPFSTGSVLEF